MNIHIHIHPQILGYMDIHGYISMDAYLVYLHPLNIHKAQLVSNFY